MIILMTIVYRRNTFTNPRVWQIMQQTVSFTMMKGAHGHT